MKLLVGLGNPGEKYKNNRHNVGHMFIDNIKGQKSNVKSINAVKTGVFMNESGDAVKKLIENLKLEIENLYIVHDDLDLPLGSFKIQFGKGPKVHNGVNSIEKELGTTEFWRIRVGVDNRDADNRTPGEEYVLQDFTSEEALILEQVFKSIEEDLYDKLKQ